MKKKSSTIDQPKKEGKVTTANKLKFAKPNKRSFDGKKIDPYVLDEFGQMAKPDIEILRVMEAGKAILEFCKANKTDFDSLSSWLVENYGKPAKVKKEAKNSQSSDIPEKASKFVSNWRSQYVASKTGAKP